MNPLPVKLVRSFGQALHDFSMIQEGDRLLVAYSGGKDSYTLLRLLLHNQRVAPITYTLGVVTINQHYSEADVARMRAQVAELGLPYQVEELPLPLADSPRPCFYCAYRRRHRLLQIARDQGYHKVVLGQHQDDAAETFLLNVLYSGQNLGLKPVHSFYDATVTVLRPLIYIAEAQIRDYVATLSVEFTHSRCPLAYDHQRQKVKALLTTLAQESPGVYRNVLRASLATPGVADDEE